MRNRQPSLRREDEFFAFSGLRLGNPAESRRGKERKWAESFCSLPSRLAACDGAQVGLHRSLILRTGTYTIAQFTPHFLSGDLLANVRVEFIETLKNPGGHLLREKVDISNRVFVDISFRY
jgi:hypothetical protein